MQWLRAHVRAQDGATSAEAVALAAVISLVLVTALAGAPGVGDLVLGALRGAATSEGTGDALPGVPSQPAGAAPLPVEQGSAGAGVTGGLASLPVEQGATGAGVTGGTASPTAAVDLRALGLAGAGEDTPNLALAAALAGLEPGGASEQGRAPARLLDGLATRDTDAGGPLGVTLPDGTLLGVLEPPRTLMGMGVPSTTLSGADVPEGLSADLGTITQPALAGGVPDAERLLADLLFPGAPAGTPEGAAAGQGAGQQGPTLRERFTPTDAARQRFGEQFASLGEQDASILDLVTALPPEAQAYTALNLPTFLAMTTAADGPARAFGALPAHVARDLALSTVLAERLFEDPLANYGASLGANLVTIYGVDGFASQMARANGWGRLDSGRPHTLAASRAMVLGGNEFVVPQVDAALSPGLQLDAAGRPILAGDAEWLAYYGPRALNLGLGYGVPYTVEALLNRNKTTRQAAVTGATATVLPALTYLSANAGVNPPEEGIVREVGVPVGNAVTGALEEGSRLWTAWNDDPLAIENPWVRAAAVPVQLLGAASDTLGDIGSQIMAPPDPEMLARGELQTGLLTRQAQQDVAERLQAANQVIRTFGPVGGHVADGLATAGDQAVALWNGTGQALYDANYGFWRGVENAAAGIGALPGETWRVATEDVPRAFGEAAGQFGRAAQENVDRFGRIVTGRPVETLPPFGGTETAQPPEADVPQTPAVPYGPPLPEPGAAVPDEPDTPPGPRMAPVPFEVERNDAGELVAVQDDRGFWEQVQGSVNYGVTATVNTVMDGIVPETGPCDSPEMRCWGRHDGILRVGPCDSPDMGCWGNGPAGIADAGETGSGASPVQRSGGAGDTQDGQPVSRSETASSTRPVPAPITEPVTVPEAAPVVEAAVPDVPTSPGRSSSWVPPQVDRAVEAAGNSWNRVVDGDAGGVLRDGWNCVTRPVACWNGDL